MQTEVSNPLQPRGAGDSPGGCHQALVVLVLPISPRHSWEQMGTRVTQELSQTYLQGREQMGRAAGHRHLSFAAQTTFSIFYYCRKLHLEENITAHCSAGSAGREKQAGGTGAAGRRWQSRGKPHLSARAGGNSLRAIFQSHLCSPGNKSRILEMLLEEKMYHKF